LIISQLQNISQDKITKIYYFLTFFIDLTFSSTT
jgi:hypothetical protein